MCLLPEPSRDQKLREFTHGHGSQRQGSGAVTGAFLLSFAVSAAAAGKDDAPEIPKCDKRYGTLSVKEPTVNWWRELGTRIAGITHQGVRLANPSASRWWIAARAWRPPRPSVRSPAGGELRGGSNMGKGQMKAADYVLVPDIANKNGNSGGKKHRRRAGRHVAGRGRRGGRWRQPQEQDGGRGAHPHRRALDRAGVDAAGPREEDRHWLARRRGRAGGRLRGRRCEQLRQHRDRPGRRDRPTSTRSPSW